MFAILSTRLIVESTKGRVRSSRAARASQIPYEALKPTATIAASTCTNLSARNASMRRSLRRCAGERERKRERRTLGLDSIEPDSAAVGLGDAAAGVETDTGASHAGRVANAHVGLEDPAAVLEWHARSLIADAHDRFTALPADPHRYARSLGRVFRGVVQQIRDDLLHAPPVAAHEERLRR